MVTSALKIVTGSAPGCPQKTTQGKPGCHTIPHNAIYWHIAMPYVIRLAIAAGWAPNCAHTAWHGAVPLKWLKYTRSRGTQLRIVMGGDVPTDYSLDQRGFWLCSWHWQAMEGDGSCARNTNNFASDATPQAHKTAQCFLRDLFAARNAYVHIW
jgi:hypothetical protein